MTGPSTRYVAFLDVLGFSALIAGDRDGERLGEYLAALTAAVADGEAAAAVDYVAFSDSVILVSADDTEKSFEAVVVASARCLHFLLERDVAVRGAIAVGPTIFSKSGENRFVAGSAVVEASRYEQIQDWVGVMLAPSAIRANPDLVDRCGVSAPNTDSDVSDIKAKLPLAGCLGACNGIPFHAEQPFDPGSFHGYAVLPVARCKAASEIRDDLQDSIKQLGWLKAIAPDPRAQKKYDEAMRWLNLAYGNWHSIAHHMERLAALSG